MRILVLGSSGFLGSYLGFALPRMGHHVSGLSRSRNSFFPDNRVFHELDQVTGVVGSRHFDVIINCIAIASHEACEADPELAELVNGYLPGRWATAAFELGAKFVHVSTDAVFDGNSSELYKEDDWTNPQSLYGETKARGEQSVLASHPGSLVLRTNFFGWSRNQATRILDFFVNAFVRQSPITGFQDYVVSSLYVGDLVEAMIELVGRELSGIFHVVSRTPLSKYEFGETVARVMGISAESMSAGSLAQAEGLAARGQNLSLSVAKIQEVLGRAMPSSEEGIHRALAERYALMDYFGLSKE